MIDAVVFDLDGTLVDSKYALSTAINTIRAELYLPPLEHSHILKTINDPSQNYAKVLFGTDANGAVFKSKYVEIYKSCYVKSAVLFDGVREILDYLHERKIKIMIATNALHTTLEAVIDKLELKDLLHSYIGVQAGIREKPDPQMLNLLTKDCKKAIFVGDNDKDRLCANAAKIGFMRACFVAKKQDDLICFDDFDSFVSGLEILSNQPN